MSHKRIKINTKTPDAAGNITIDTDDISDASSTAKYYTSALIDAKIASSSIGIFSDVDTTGAADDQVLKRVSGVWTPSVVSGGADVTFIGSGATQMYPWTGPISELVSIPSTTEIEVGSVTGFNATDTVYVQITPGGAITTHTIQSVDSGTDTITTASAHGLNTPSGVLISEHSPYRDGKQIEFYGLNLGTGLSTLKYEVRGSGTSNGTSTWSWVDSGSYTGAGWVRSVSFFPAGTYLVCCGVGLSLPASTSYLDFRVFVDDSAHGSLSKVGGDTGYPRSNNCMVVFGSAPVSAGDNKIDVRVDEASLDLVTQALAQGERGYIYAVKVA